MPIISIKEWDAFIARHPEAHILQSSTWGQLKKAFGWETVQIINPVLDIGVQILFRNLPFGFSIAYIPKGPIGGSFSLSDSGTHQTEIGE